VTARSQKLFLGLILVQATHSVEEYLFGLYAVLLPARVISGLISGNLAVGFALANAALVLFAFWCYFARVRKRHPSWRAWAWSWAILEAANGSAHLLFVVERGGYLPGAATAPFLLGLAVWLGMTLGDSQLEAVNR